MCEYLNSNGQYVVVCVWGGSVSHGGALSVITISDWVRAKVCDISQLSTHSVAVETHLGVTLSSSPLLLHSGCPLLPSHLSFADSQGVLEQLCFTCRVRIG